MWLWCVCGWDGVCELMFWVVYVLYWVFDVMVEMLCVGLVEVGGSWV